MSECVVRMTLPKGCVWRDDKGHIKICPLYWEDEGRCQGKDGKEAPWYDGKRPDWCPIICQLPEGHGRLADKDLLMRDLDFLNTFGTPDDGKELSYEDILVTIDDFPTIVPAAPKEENQDDGN